MPSQANGSIVTDIEFVTLFENWRTIACRHSLGNLAVRNDVCSIFVNGSKIWSQFVFKTNLFGPGATFSDKLLICCLTISLVYLCQLIHSYI
jgi:hypothetical protein